MEVPEFKDTEEPEPRSLLLLNTPLSCIEERLAPVLTPEPRLHFKGSRFPMLPRIKKLQSPQKLRTPKIFPRNVSLERVRTNIPKFQNSLYKQFQKVRYGGHRCVVCDKKTSPCSKLSCEKRYDSFTKGNNKNRRERLFKEINDQMHKSYNG